MNASGFSFLAPRSLPAKLPSAFEANVFSAGFGGVRSSQAVSFLHRADDQTGMSDEVTIVALPRDNLQHPVVLDTLEESTSCGTNSAGCSLGNLSRLQSSCDDRKPIGNLWRRIYDRRSR